MMKTGKQKMLDYLNETIQDDSNYWEVHRISYLYRVLRPIRVRSLSPRATAWCRSVASVYSIMNWSKRPKHTYTIARGPLSEPVDVPVPKTGWYTLGLYNAQGQFLVKFDAMHVTVLAYESCFMVPNPDVWECPPPMPLRNDNGD